MRRLFLAALVACLVPTAHAQIVSVYGMLTPTHASHVETGCTYTSPTSSCTEQYASFWSPAIGGGVTLNFLNLHVVKLGFDLRGSTKPGTTGMDTGEFALRLGIKPPVLKIKPYGQVGVGYLATRTNNVSTNGIGTPVGGTFTNQYAALNFRGGVDTPIFPFVDYRILELGYSRGFDTGLSFSGSQNANFFSIGTGLVVHF